MLVLVNGISGNIGHAVARSLLSRGHQVRGLGRSPDAVDSTIRARLESFVTAEAWYDATAHDRACTGADAVVNATAAHGFLMLDHSLLILRAAERAGIKIFVACAWNYNWTKIALGDHEAYDHLIMFKQQVELTSSIKPIYIFTGVLAEFYFNLPVRGWFQQDNPGFSTNSGTALYFGDGKTRFQFTTFRDAGEYTADIMCRPNAAEGGCYEVMSFAGDLWQMRDAYKKVTGKDVQPQCMGTFDDMRNVALGGRAAGQKHNYQGYLGMIYLLLTHDRTFMLDEDNLYHSPDVSPTSVEIFLEAHKDAFRGQPKQAQAE